MKIKRVEVRELNQRLDVCVPLNIHGKTIAPFLIKSIQ